MSATSPLKAAERKFRMLIADDHPLNRKTVRAVLEDDPRFEVCAEVIDGAAIEETNRPKPHVVVLNVVMPVLNGLEAAKVIRSKVPESVIVILSSDADEEFVKQAMKAGAHAYVSKSCAGDALIQPSRRPYRAASSSL